MVTVDRSGQKAFAPLYALSHSIVCASRVNIVAVLCHSPKIVL